MGSKQLVGKTAIVTGGSSGNGRAIAVRLANDGATVVIADIDCPKAEETLSIIRSRQQLFDKSAYGPIFIETDVSDFDSIKSCILASHGIHGHVDIMVNNAGINRRSPVRDIADEDWDRVIAVNLAGVYFGMRAAGDYMSEANIPGAIINVSSIRQVVAGLGNCAYSTAKGGISGMTRFYGHQYAKSNIGVFSVGPGYLDTPMTNSLLEQPGVLEGIVGQIPWGRLALPEEVAGVVAFLATPFAKYLRGQTIMVDGGYLTG